MHGLTYNVFYADPASSGENHGNERNTMNVRNYTTKTVTLPDDHWAALEREALLALMPVDKLMAHAVRLMQLDAAQARAGLSRAYVDDNGQVQREAPVGLPGETTAPACGRSART